MKKLLVVMFALGAMIVVLSGCTSPAESAPPARDKTDTSATK